MDNLIFPLSPKEAEKNGKPYSSDINKNAVFPKRMRELRNKAGISQQKLADEIDVTKSTISLYEQGDNVPDIKNFVKIADFFDVSYDFLLGKTDTIKRENIDIRNDLGLEDQVITLLKTLKYEADLNDDLAIFYKMELSTINLFLSDRPSSFLISVLQYVSIKHKIDHHYHSRIDSEKESSIKQVHIDSAMKQWKDDLKYSEWLMMETIREYAFQFAAKFLKEIDNDPQLLEKIQLYEKFVEE